MSNEVYLLHSNKRPLSVYYGWIEMAFWEWGCREMLLSFCWPASITSNEHGSVCWQLTMQSSARSPDLSPHPVTYSEGWPGQQNKSMAGDSLDSKAHNWMFSTWKSSNISKLCTQSFLCCCCCCPNPLWHTIDKIYSLHIIKVFCHSRLTLLLRWPHRISPF